MGEKIFPNVLIWRSIFLAKHIVVYKIINMLSPYKTDQIQMGGIILFDG